MTGQSPVFADPHLVATYAAETPRKVPGLADLHRMTWLLLNEAAPGPAHILVVGAGGGLELAAMAGAAADWCFTGVDPSAPMLDLARQLTAAFAGRTTLIEGTVDAAPDGPFDGATCLLVLHFLDRAERLRTLCQIRRRLRPGARLVIAHHSPPPDEAVAWLARTAAFAQSGAVDRNGAGISAAAMASRLHLLAPPEEEALLREAGFSDVALFYAAFSFRGWVATAGPGLPA